MPKLQVGDRAPDFTLRDENGKEHALAAALANGPVVLIFYVLDSTPG
jgi:peroxiredoxin Q/BCP